MLRRSPNTLHPIMRDKLCNYTINTSRDILEFNLGHTTMLSDFSEICGHLDFLEPACDLPKMLNNGHSLEKPVNGSCDSEM